MQDSLLIFEFNVSTYTSNFAFFIYSAMFFLLFHYSTNKILLQRIYIHFPSHIYWNIITKEPHKPIQTKHLFIDKTVISQLITTNIRTYPHENPPANHRGPPCRWKDTPKFSIRRYKPEFSLKNRIGQIFENKTRPPKVSRLVIGGWNVMGRCAAQYWRGAAGVAAATWEARDVPSLARPASPMRMNPKSFNSEGSKCFKNTYPNHWNSRFRAARVSKIIKWRVDYTQRDRLGNQLYEHATRSFIHEKLVLVQFE